MRRESSTVVALVGDVSSDLLASLARSPHVSVAWLPAAPAAGQGADATAAPRSGLESAAEAMRAAARQRSPYVVIPADPLTDVAASWQQMWDLYLGPLHAARPRRVAVTAVADSAAQPASLLDALRSLEHGPWWPPLDELLDVARGFYAGGLAETQQLAT